ncbi:hypothetical protein HMPREF1556_01243 [Porphyromonas sp. oral taxon 278 str. W7784]|nr:hypothetical protein HMPREF1556_01243 [Porphyromonas sp. oral taxon 278 str. W7784]
MLSLGCGCVLRFYEGSSIAYAGGDRLLKRRKITQLVEWI